MRPIDPALTFLLLLLIGIVAGLIFERTIRPGWFTRELANERRGMITCALIGTAGSFIGYHLTLLLNLFRTSALTPFVGAMLFAVLVLYLWRVMR